MADVKPAVTLPKGVSEEDIARGLRLLEQQRAQRAKQKEKTATPEQKAKAAAATARRNAAQRLTLQKAVAAGITVTEKEIDDYLKAAEKKA